MASQYRLPVPKPSHNDNEKPSSPESASKNDWEDLANDMSSTGSWENVFQGSDKSTEESGLHENISGPSNLVVDQHSGDSEMDWADKLAMNEDFSQEDMQRQHLEFLNGFDDTGERKDDIFEIPSSPWNANAAKFVPAGQSVDSETNLNIVLNSDYISWPSSRPTKIETTPVSLAPSLLPNLGSHIPQNPENNMTFTQSTNSSHQLHGQAWNIAWHGQHPYGSLFTDPNGHTYVCQADGTWANFDMEAAWRQHGHGMYGPQMEETQRKLQPQQDLDTNNFCSGEANQIDRMNQSFWDMSNNSMGDKSFETPAPVNQAGSGIHGSKYQPAPQYSGRPSYNNTRRGSPVHEYLDADEGEFSKDDIAMAEQLSLMEVTNNENHGELRDKFKALNVSNDRSLPEWASETCGYYMMLGELSSESSSYLTKGLKHKEILIDILADTIHTVSNLASEVQKTLRDCPEDVMKAAFTYYDDAVKECVDRAGSALFEALRYQDVWKGMLGTDLGKFINSVWEEMQCPSFENIEVLNLVRESPYQFASIIMELLTKIQAAVIRARFDEQEDKEVNEEAKETEEKETEEAEETELKKLKTK